MNKNTRYFQWLSGAHKGDIMIYDKIVTEDGMVFICFKDGSRINEDLVMQLNAKDATNKMMAEIDKPTNCWKFSEEYVGREEERWETNADGEKVCVQPLVEGRKVIKLIPPMPTPAGTSNFGKIENVGVTPNEVILSDSIKQNSENEMDPVRIMMKKSKKVDQIIDISLTVSLPTRKFFDVIKESFEDGNEKMLEYIIEDIDVQTIKTAIKASLNEMYNDDCDQNNNDDDEQ